MITPREIIRSYLTALGLLSSDPQKKMSDIIGEVPIPVKTQNPDDLDPDTIEL